MPKINISVAIPFYNAEGYLSLAIESVLSQTYQGWELLLIDDGSNDCSIKIAEKYTYLDSRIRLISDGENRGLAYRLNQSIKLAQGEYYARMDADDIMHSERLERQLKILLEHPEIDVLGTNAYSIDEANLVFGIRFAETMGLKKVDHFIHPTIMGKKQWFLDNPYDEKAIRIEDAELWYRTKQFSNFMMTNEPLLFYREFGSYYYPKYIKVLPSLVYLNKKYPLDKFWMRVLIQSSLNVPIYWCFERVFKSDYLKKRRNNAEFNPKKNIQNLI